MKIHKNIGNIFFKKIISKYKAYFFSVRIRRKFIQPGYLTISSLNFFLNDENKHSQINNKNN